VLTANKARTVDPCSSTTDPTCADAVLQDTAVQGMLAAVARTLHLLLASGARGEWGVWSLVRNPSYLTHLLQVRVVARVHQDQPSSTVGGAAKRLASVRRSTNQATAFSALCHHRATLLRIGYWG
jgi:hypothetical protein